MAHQFGLNEEADSRWFALTRAIEAGARWLDQVLQQLPSPEAILDCSADQASALGLVPLQQALAQPLLAKLPEAMLSGPPLYLVTPRDPEYPHCWQSAVTGHLSYSAAGRFSICPRPHCPWWAQESRRSRAVGPPESSLPPRQSQVWLWLAGWRWVLMASRMMQR